MKTYSIAEIAYLAGLIDGEGSIFIGTRGNDRSVQGFKHYQTCIEINNTEESMINWLCEHIGGRKLSYTAKQTPKNSRRPVFRWIANSKLIDIICPLILPYIVAKKRQCEVMLKIRKTFTNPHVQKGHQGICALDPKIIELREECYLEMKSLHCRNYLK